MTTQPDTQQQPSAWDENRIVDSIQATSTDEPRIDVYNQVEWVTDDVAIGLAMEVYKDMRAEIAALQAQLSAARAANYQPLPDGPIGPGASLENRVIWIKCTVGNGVGVKHGYALQEGEMLMRAQRAPEPAAPEQAGVG